MPPQPTPTPQPVTPTTVPPVAPTRVGAIASGSQFLLQSYKALFKQPVLLAPLLFTAVFLAALLAWVEFGNPPSTLALVLILLIPYIITLSCLSLLEMIRQIETGQALSLGGAIGRVFSKDALKALPIAVVWTILWAILLILQALTSRNRFRKQNASWQNFGRSVSGANETFSWSGLSLDLIEKLIRMVVFCMLPAIAWEGKGPWSATKQGFSVIKRHPAQFFSNYGLTLIAAAVMGIPLVIVGQLKQVPNFVWPIVVIYAVITLAVQFYLEQLTTALLYMWHLKWVQNGSVGDMATTPPPNLLTDHSYLTISQP